MKVAYIIFNLFHKRHLKYNVAAYKALGLKKKYFSPVSSKDFEELKDKKPTINDAENIQQKIEKADLFKKLSDTDQRSLLDFDLNGFASIKHYLNAEQVDKINEEIDRLLESNAINPLGNGKIMFACRHSKIINDLGNNAGLKQLLSALFGKNAILFQSINFFSGSEQHTHSDSIHMTTFPEGGLLGVWFALEDITIENGPLHYYPGSHKLPYYMNGDYNNEGNKWLLGGKSYSEYEKMIEEKINQYQIKKQVFLAEKGDLFIWHANLFHGGEPHTNKAMTRKSMVLHYFREGDVCYHEITQRPALMDRFNLTAK
jgi:hypothetical protein